MTQLESAIEGVLTAQMRQVCTTEPLAEQELLHRVAGGRAVIPANRGHADLRAVGIGAGLCTKVNANIGTSPERSDVEHELAKLQAALDAGADAVMDLSTGGDLRGIRAEIRERCDVALGSVPIYEAAADAARAHGDVAKMTADDMLAAVRRHAEDGVDFVTVHCGVTRDLVRSGEIEKRTCGIVSRGGTFTAHWIRRHGQENPLYERFDELV
ncbi:MAG: phosphomethylpyrimidine synthase ThiC, partial [Candidatus Brocadiia bacterium]